MKLILLFAVVAATFAAPVFGQGGKAEPNRITPAAGKALVLTGFLSNAQEMEYVFAGTKGQKVTIRNATAALFDYRLFNPDADFETEFDSSASASFDLPASGDYLLYVRKKMVKSPRRARFRLSVAVK